MAKILVIDDERDVLEVVGLALERKGHEAVLASTQAEAVDALCKGPYDILLLDMQNGDLDRPALSKAARTMGIKIITMSGEVSLYPMLNKPFKTEELDAAIRRVM